MRRRWIGFAAVAGGVGLALAWHADLPAPAPTPAEPDMAALTLPDGSHLAYRAYGAVRTDPLTPIIVLHGGPGVPPTKPSFDFYGRLAEDGHPVYLYEQIGVGQSSRLEDIGDYTLDRDLDDLAALQAAIHAPQVILIGQSWGSVLATHYLARHPDAVERIVLISPAAFRREDQFRYRGSAVLPWPLMIAGGLARVSPRIAQTVISQEDAGRRYDAFWTGPASSDRLYCPGTRPAPAPREPGANFYALIMTAASTARAPDPSPALATASAPTLILHGTCDFIPRPVAEDYVRALPHARIVDIPGAGHLAPDAQPAAVLAAIRNFLKQDPPGVVGTRIE